MADSNDAPTFTNEEAGCKKFWTWFLDKHPWAQTMADEHEAAELVQQYAIVSRRLEATRPRPPGPTTQRQATAARDYAEANGIEYGAALRLVKAGKA